MTKESWFGSEQRIITYMSSKTIKSSLGANQRLFDGCF